MQVGEHGQRPGLADLQDLAAAPTRAGVFEHLAEALADAARGLWEDVAIEDPAADEAAWQRRPQRAFQRYAAEVLGRLPGRAGDLPVVLIVDEGDLLLEAEGHADLLLNLRALTGRATRKRFRLVVAGYRRLIEYRDPKTGTSPFQGILDPYTLRPLADSEIAELAAPAIEGRPELEPEVARATGGHPCALQVLCGFLADGLPFDEARAAAVQHLGSSSFRHWQAELEDPERRRLAELIDGPARAAGSAVDELLGYSGLAVEEGGAIRAHCELFNDWFRRRDSAPPAPAEPREPAPPVPKPLARSYARRQLAVFVGSGLSQGSDVAGGFPTWRAVPERLLELCAERTGLAEDELERRRDSFGNARKLEQFLADLDGLKELLGKHYPPALESVFDPAGARPGAAHAALERLDVPVSYTHLTLPTIYSV